MRLLSAARAFDKMVCADAYSGAFLFKAQLGLYDDNKRDSETAQRRNISMAAGLPLPARRVIAAAGTRFILGHANPDSFKNQNIRVSYVAHEATELSTVRTLDQVCTNTAGVSAYAGRAWVKDKAYTEESSNLFPQAHIHFAEGEPIDDDKLVTFDGRLHIVREITHGAGGTLIATCEEMDEPSVEMASLLSGAYDPVTDSMAGTPVSVRVVRVRWQSLFRYHNSIEPKFQPGDMQVAVSKSAATVLPGANLTLSDGAWEVTSVASEGAVWLCKATKHG
jgi:hypothetical protein